MEAERERLRERDVNLGEREPRERDRERERERESLSGDLFSVGNGKGIARCMNPPQALCEPLLRSTVVTAGGVFCSLFLLRDSIYRFFNSSTAASSFSTFGCKY